MKRSDDPVLGAHVCPYCRSRPQLVDSDVIYGRSYGAIYLCKPCDAYVGCHKGTTIPYGRLADARLRASKRETHRAFDRLWKEGGMTRTEAYTWLATELNLSPQEAHVGMLDLEQCAKATEAAQNLWIEMKQDRFKNTNL